MYFRWSSTPWLNGDCCLQAVLRNRFLFACIIMFRMGFFAQPQRLNCAVPTGVRTIEKFADQAKKGPVIDAYTQHLKQRVRPRQRVLCNR